MLVFNNPGIIVKTFDKNKKLVSQVPYSRSLKLSGYENINGEFIKFLDDERSIARKDIIRELLKKEREEKEREENREKKASEFVKIIIVNSSISKADIVSKFKTKQSPKKTASEFVYKNVVLTHDIPHTDGYVKKGQRLSAISIDDDRNLIKIWYKNFNKTKPDILIAHSKIKK